MQDQGYREFGRGEERLGMVGGNFVIVCMYHGVLHFSAVFVGR